MPQPLSKVNSNAGYELCNAGQRVLSERPQLAVMAIEAVASWVNVESFLMRLFVTLMGGHRELAARIYMALEIQSAKNAALGEIIKTVKDEKMQALILAVIAIAKTNQKSRDKLVHHIWGISRDIPDALLLVDPRILNTKVVPPGDDIFVWKENDFRSAIEANDRLCGYGHMLEMMVGDPSHPAIESMQLYDRLCNQPEVQERLRHQASPVQSAPAGTP